MTDKRALRNSLVEIREDPVRVNGVFFCFAACIEANDGRQGYGCWFYADGMVSVIGVRHFRRNLNEFEEANNQRH